MKVFFSEYSLIGKNTQLSQPGALLRLEADGAFGVADICPKPQFGDLNLADELKNRGPLFKRAFELATEDLQARKAGISLLQNKWVNNNVLILDYQKPALDFNATYKIKADRRFDLLIELIAGLTKVRLDFNSRLSPAEFNNFLNMLPADVLQKIEYIEDPTVMAGDWAAWNRVIPLAFDLQDRAVYDSELARFRVVKPSRQQLPHVLDNAVFTSAMDHPIGVAHGLRFAQKFAARDSGFLTLDLFEETAYHGFFQQIENKLNYSSETLADTGIGMTAELESAEWRQLV